MNPLLIALFIFLTMLAFFILGEPIVFVLGGVGAVFIWLVLGAGHLSALPLAAYGAGTSFLLLAIPMFIFMAAVLQESGVADDLFDIFYKWFGGIRGGLAVGTVIVCTIFAAMVGIIGAAIVTMGFIALPAMLKRGYKKELAIGCISAGGCLGCLIPPSVTMIVYAALSGVSVGKMFLGGYIPGLILASFFSVYILLRSYLQPSLAPPIPVEERVSFLGKLAALKGIILPILLVALVMGSIFGGLATPSEAAAGGSIGAVISAAIHHRLNWAVLKKALYSTIHLSCMVMWIIMAAYILSAVIGCLGITGALMGIISAAKLEPWTVLILIQFSFLGLGMIMDDLAILVTTVPIYAPLIVELGFDPLWFGVLFIVNMQIAYLTPPYGFALFYMRGIVPKGITMGDIYRSIVPFVLLQLSGLILIMIFPKLVLLLPHLVFG